MSQQAMAPASTPTDPLIELSGIRKTFKKHKSTLTILNDLDLTIQRGDFTSIMGPSGSGKTTLLNLVGGLDRPSAGSLRINGENIESYSDSALTAWRSRNIGFVFQFYNLLPTLSAQANVELPLLLTPLSSAQRKHRAKIALDIVGLGERCQHRPSELSGGQEQRVAIARAIVNDPVLLVCDEPTGDLDRETADQVLEILKALNEQQGKTILMVTHDPKAAKYASRHILMDKGNLVDQSASSPVTAEALS